MALYPDQQQILEGFEDWLNGSEQTCGLFAGAGFGKSYMMKSIIDEVILKNSNYTPIITSMTHSAVDVLSEFTGMEVTTLHSLMGWVPYVDKETGEEGLSTPYMRDKDADPRLTDSMLVLIDEAGLAGHDELALMLEECDRTGARVMFVGDYKQCYPVVREGQELCVPTYEYTQTHGTLFKLTIPKRVSEDDSIYKLSLKLRKAVTGGELPNLKTVLNSDGRTGVRHVDDIEEYAYKAFKAGVRDKNTRNIKVLAYTNARCLTLNRKIRKNVMGRKDPTPVVGEEMVANTTITNVSGDFMIKNNGRVVVESVEKTENYGLAGAFIQFSQLNKEGERENIEEVVFVPSTPALLLERLRKLSTEAKAMQKNGFKTEAQQTWRTFFSLKEGCADIRYTYAMTVNKAQGITLKHALVDLCDIDRCRDYEQKVRLAYTAVSRGNTFVTIEGELTK